MNTQSIGCADDGWSPQITDDMLAFVVQRLRQMSGDWRAPAEEIVEFLAETGATSFVEGYEGWSAVVTDRSSVPLTALRIAADGGHAFGPWSSVMSASFLTVTPSTRFVGSLWWNMLDGDEPVLQFDPGEWAGTCQPYGETGDWEIWLDGEMHPVSLYERSWGPVPDGVAETEWLAVTGEGTCIALDTDASGCLWGSYLEFATFFFGRPEHVDPLSYLSDILSTDYTNGGASFSSIRAMSLRPEEALEIVATVERLDPNFDANGLDVVCAGFVGSAAALRDQTSKRG